MLLTTKVSQFATDSDKVHAWVNGPASGIGSTVTTDAGAVRTPAKLIADITAEAGAVISEAIAGELAAVTVVKDTNLTKTWDGTVWA